MESNTADYERVCARYGLNYEDMTGQTLWNGHYEGFSLSGAAPAGEINALRVVPWGRFGDCVYQLVHALLVARQIGCREIQIPYFIGGPERPEQVVGGIRVIDPDRAAGSLPALSGVFFMSWAFRPYLQNVPALFAVETIRDFIRPLLIPQFEGPDGSGQDRSGEQVVVVHFRSGDIFGDQPNQYYVQPPASYYLAAMDFLRDTFGTQSIKLVSEDRGNPAIAEVEADLTARGIEWTYQSRTFNEDFATLLGATHLVASFSMFCEAAVMLSETIRTYFAFRDVESHSFMQCRAEPLQCAVLREKGIRTFVVEDLAGEYIAPQTWDNSAAQQWKLCHYPRANLGIVELPSKASRDSAMQLEEMRAALTLYQDLTRRHQTGFGAPNSSTSQSAGPDVQLLHALKKARDYPLYWQMRGLIGQDLRATSDNVALGRPATQSSLSPWSIGATAELDAAGAVDGLLTGDYSFHTEEEDRPWWMVDLGVLHSIREIRIYNRAYMANRAERLSLLVSADATEWTELHRKAEGTAFPDPYVVRPDVPTVARFVRVQLTENGILHLDQVEVTGAPA